MLKRVLFLVLILAYLAISIGLERSADRGPYGAIIVAERARG